MMFGVVDDECSKGCYDINSVGNDGDYYLYYSVICGIWGFVIMGIKYRSSNKSKRGYFV